MIQILSLWEDGVLDKSLVTLMVQEKPDLNLK